MIARGLSTTVPEIVAVGEPGFGYPETWAVTRWLDGEIPAVPWPVESGSSERVADGLARWVAEFGQLEVPAAASDDPALAWYRGGPLADLDGEFRRSVDECRLIAHLDLDLDRALTVWDLDRALTVWDRAVAAARAARPLRRWYHGDLLAENLVLRDGELAAVLVVGGLAVGDPSVDLVVAWEVLDPPGRQVFRRAIGVDDATWAKGMGWALLSSR